MRNKRGSFFFGITIAIVVYFMGVLFIPFIMDDVDTFRDTMSCTSTSITGGAMLACLISDATIPYVIWFFISLALGFILGSGT